jgi:hypothetical protein
MLSQILLLIFSILMLALTITNAIFFNMVRSATAKVTTGTSPAGMSNGQATTMVILNLIGAALALIGTIYFIYRLVKIV